MKYETAILALAGLASARQVVTLHQTVSKREVPQEHSHEAILQTTNKNLKLDNPDNIQDAVFSLLGNAAAANGAGNIQNLDCLQQEVADRAFTNAKAANDVDGMANAIMFRALERNTAGVGTASVLCNETATNAEIAAITQHQDPASSAASGNKQIELDVAKQLASIGADPQLALQTGTFAPGDTSDNTGKGNTCDDANDAVGCIISQNLIQPAATAAEITAAAGSASGSASNTTANAARLRARAGTNIQTFTGSLGGTAPAVLQDDSAARPFSVNGDTFLKAAAALQRSCSVQHNACSTAANSGQLTGGQSQCETQESACNAAASATKKRRVARQALDFGSCGSPAIKFAAGLDGRKENSFQSVNQADFNHGSALKIGVIADFTCQQLQSKCKASADTVSACQAASTAAAGQTGQASADAFNSALGVSA